MQCSECRFCMGRDHAYFECRFNPPKEGEFPEVERYCWCGKFEPKHAIPVPQPEPDDGRITVRLSPAELVRLGELLNQAIPLVTGPF